MRDYIYTSSFKLLAGLRELGSKEHEKWVRSHTLRVLNETLAERLDRIGELLGFRRGLWDGMQMMNCRPSGPGA